MGDLIPLFPLGTPLFPGTVLPLQIFEPRYRRLMRDLLNHPEAGDRRFFGVVAIRQGWEVERVAPAEALYDIGCTARVQAVRPQADGGFRIVTVGGERFRLLDVVVGDDPPYLQAEVEWLAEEEAAEEAAGDTDGLLVPGTADATPPCDDGLDDVVASVARSSLDVLTRGVRDLFTRYVAEVSDLGNGGGGDDGEPTVDAETAVLLDAVSDDPTALSYLVASAAQLAEVGARVTT
jgi:Lon protease-like protein